MPSKQQPLRVLSAQEYGINCRKLLTALGLQQTDIATRLNITKDAFHKRLEGSRGKWDMEWLTRLANAIGMPIGDLTSYIAGAKDVAGAAESKRLE